MEKTAYVALSRELRSTLDDLRDRFTPYLQTYNVLSERRRDLAPVFMRGFRLWRRETGRSFVAFAQQLDPAIPATNPKSHRSMRAALYLRRCVDAPHTIAGATERKSRSHFYMMAVLIKSVLPRVRPNEEIFWESLARVGRWHQRDVAKLKALVRRATPITIWPDAPRLVARQRQASSRFAPSRVATTSERQSANA